MSAKADNIIQHTNARVCTYRRDFLDSICTLGLSVPARLIYLLRSVPVNLLYLIKFTGSSLLGLHMQTLAALVYHSLFYCVPAHIILLLIDVFCDIYCVCGSYFW